MRPGRRFEFRKRLPPTQTMQLTRPAVSKPREIRRQTAAKFDVRSDRSAISGREHPWPRPCIRESKNERKNKAYLFRQDRQGRNRIGHFSPQEPPFGALLVKQHT